MRITTPKTMGKMTGIFYFNSSDIVTGFPISHKRYKQKHFSLDMSFQMVEVHSVTVDCTVTSRFAHTVMTSVALNRANTSQEIFFDVELPKTAFITNFSMEIEGQVYVGEVKEKEKAKQQYEKAVSSGQTAGLVKASGRKMEKFSVSVNVAASSNVTFILTYEELLQRKMGKYEILTRVKPKEPVQEFKIVADIYEPQGIAFVDAHATFLSNDLLPLVEKTVTDKKAHISFSPTLEQQRKCPGCDGTLIDGDFIIEYDVNREEGPGEVQIVNGYFVHFFAPPDLPRVPKNVVFVIDRSGSMAGKKIKQTRDAMVAILRDLHEEDHFAIILFDSDITLWKDVLTKATKENVADAISYIRTLKEKGATDINSAVLRAVSMLVREREDKKIPKTSVDMIILLTDGMPNHGVSDLKTIQDNVHSAIGGKMSLFCLGFGNDVAHSFLEVMCKGLARRIYEASDADVQLQGFYNEVSSPLLLEVDLRYPGNAVDSVTKKHFNQLFNGSEIVVAGQLRHKDVDNFAVEVLAQGVRNRHVVDWKVTYPDQQYIFEDFTEHLWAYLTVQQLLEDSKIGPQDEKDVLTARALDMSVRYSFVTPLTSLVVTRPETEDRPGSALIADKLTEGRGHVTNVLLSFSLLVVFITPIYIIQSLDGDPHFLIELPDRNDALCFNINDKPGTIFNLVRHSGSGFMVNGEIIGKNEIVPAGKVNTYFGRFDISHKKLGVKMDVSVHNISVLHDGKHVSLLMDLKLTNKCSLTVTLRHSIKFMIIKHTKVWKRRHTHQDYLGFYTLDSHHISASAHGLLGQFYQGVEFEVADLRPGEAQEQLDATMHVKGQTVNVTRHWQKDFSRNVRDGENIPCWFVNDDGAGLIDGRASDYVVSGIFNSV
uniref:Inter-alpha-trypsin inhibitor heavy chain H3 n=1 Tax=Echeneis naucrates TaxID=173247 RepID=A0A665UUP7_ECHNA